MSRHCLLSQQPLDYVVIYVAHYIGLGWMGVMWVFDGVQIPFWVACAAIPLTAQARLHCTMTAHALTHARAGKPPVESACKCSVRTSYSPLPYTR